MDLVRDIASIVGLVMSTIAFITLFTNFGKKIITKLFTSMNKEIVNKNTQQDQSLLEVLESISKIKSDIDIVKASAEQRCRDTLKDIYYRHCNDKKIHLYERKTADAVYLIYSEKFKANSYAKLIYEEIKKWEIIPTDNQFD